MILAANSGKNFVLALNAGSSSLKFALFREGTPLERVCSGGIDRIGQSDAEFTLKQRDNGPSQRRSVVAANHAAGLEPVLKEIAPLTGATGLAAIGHRVVHGGEHYNAPQKVTTEMLGELRRLSPFDPEHLPSEIELIQTLQARFPQIPQIACFDTAFHHELPRVARQLAIPRRYEAAGVRRYGFHGLSYQFLLEEMAQLGDPAATKGRVILAHLGNGASMAAVRDGQSIDTSMGFTPAAGFPMSTRSGDLDPGLVWYLARTEKMTPSQFNEMVNLQSGLLGISETSSDMRDLLAKEAGDKRAAEAVALFCYQAKKWIGAFAAALGGLDTLVFAGGIGENAPPVRERICAGLDFLGLTLDGAQNTKNAAIISTPASRVTVRVIRTDEELMIARSVCRVLGLSVEKRI